MDDWFFFNIVMAENSPVKDVNTLKYHYDLPTVLKIKEAMEMHTACHMANHKDEELRSATAK